MEREIALHQRERCMASLLIEPGFTVRPVSATILLPFRQALFHHAQKFFRRSLAKPTTTFSLLVRSFRKSYEGSTARSKSC